VADGGGARPKSARESGLPVAGGGGPGAGSGGEARALERRGPRGVETRGRVEQREREASGSAAARQRGKRRGKRWGSGRGGATRRGGAMGPGPDRQVAGSPSAARAGDVRRARVAGGTERGERRLTGGPAQCRAMVPLTSGSSLSAVRGRESHARGHAWAGPRRKRWAEPR
jgi:hypothetical protein